MMLPRLVLLVSLGVCLTLLIKIFMLCHDREKPLNGVRKILCQSTFRFFMFLMGILCWWTYFGNEYLRND